ncbi:MAG: tRNA (N6-isopentenyl adenosine(37)-C2)-methylthiotransferase MiaB [Omnitrophica bacterium RIFCSPLOWO2_01_FULL_45_10]|nr:MAG: tRNA (N6-isopentenyl adenosine(37)-C2)-methylthiotransferase MiaB [Omnitrophica bacterium RIFCSPLOWO2_01_FULL_45_10]
MPNQESEKSYEFFAPKVFIRTFGCQMNARDSEFVTGLLMEKGFKLAGSIDEADIILFNSCSVRKHAENRLFTNIAGLKRMKKDKPDLVIGLMGCTAQNYKDQILKRLPMVDLVCGTGNENDLPKLIEEVLRNRCAIVSTDKVNAQRPEEFPRYREHKFKTYVSISEGCDNYCSYCIVPYVRGRERSRDTKDIVKEVKELASRGFKEITLLGQNVNSYKGLAYSVERIAYRKKLSAKRYPLNAKTCDFIHLLEEVNKINGIERIRFMTSHPKDASIDLFKAMRDLRGVCEHIHLPLQSGSDRILKLMNRKYTRRKYLQLVNDYKKILPDGSMTTDLIVGFPSETKADFKKSEDLMKEIGFDSAFLFKYSPRKSTKAAQFKDNVPDEEKQSRLETLLNLQRGISQNRNESMKGSIAEVLVDAVNSKEPSKLTGRTRTNKIVVFEGKRRLIGTFMNVKIEYASPHGLKGRMM